MVFGDGSPTADLMFVGEGPGAQEDEQGGRAARKGEDRHDGQHGPSDQAGEDGDQLAAAPALHDLDGGQLQQLGEERHGGEDADHDVRRAEMQREGGQDHPAGQRRRAAGKARFDDEQAQSALAVGCRQLWLWLQGHAGGATSYPKHGLR